MARIATFTAATALGATLAASLAAQVLRAVIDGLGGTL